MNIDRTLPFGAVLAVALLAPGLPAQEAPLGYVPNQDEATVAIVDLETFERVETLDLRALGFSDNAKPHHVVVEPDGSYWYVSLIGENRVVKFDRQNRVVASAEFEVPGLLALHPDGERLYVGRSMSAVNPPTRIGVIDRGDMSIDEIEIVFPRPHALAVHPNGEVAYTASLAENRLAVVDLESWDVELIDVEGPMHSLMQVAISPDGRTMAASGELSHRLLLFDLSDPRRPVVRHEVAVGQQPFDPVFSHDGDRVFLGNKASNTVSVIDAHEGVVEAELEHEALFRPHGSVVTADGRYLLVSSNGPGAAASMAMEGHDAHAAHAEHGESKPAYEAGTVTVFDADTLDVVAVIPVGRNATGLGVPAAR